MNFFNWLLNFKNKTATTSRQYLYWVSRYHNNFERNYLKIGSKSKRKSVYSAFKMYYEFMGKSFPKGIVFPKTDDAEVSFVEIIDYQKIMNEYVCNNNWEWNRNRLIVWLTFKHGLRISEALSLKTKNIFYDYIQIIGKGGKHRHVPLDRSMIKFVNMNKEYVIENKKGQRMSYANAVKILYDIKKQSGINANITWHSMRHGYAMRLLNNGIQIYTISKLLGHSSLQSTEKYLHFSVTETIKQLKEAKIID